jgi:hypothetical protein
MPVAVPIDSALIRAGQPGAIFFAPLGSDIPAMTVEGGVFTDAWPVAWLPVGPTDSGFTVGNSIDTDNVEIEESLYPVRTVTTGKATTVGFTIATDTPRAMRLALNGGTITSTGTGPTMLTKYTPPLIGAEVRVMLGWESNDATERFVAYQCFQTNGVSAEYRKGSTKVTYELEFAVELPAAEVASSPFDRWDAGAAIGAVI